MKLDNDLKAAISNLSSTEKDKLIFRLLRRDEALVNKLLFQLVSSDTVEQRREKMLEKISKHMENIQQFIITPKGILAGIKLTCKQIKDHVNTTKDKYGNVYLNIYMLNLLLNSDRSYSSTFNQHHAERLLNFIIDHIFGILVIMKELHSDYYSDFETALLTLAEKLESQEDLYKTALKKGLHTDWLKNLEIPENIKELQKKSREQNKNS